MIVYPLPSDNLRLDPTTFNECLDSRAMTSEVDEDFQDGIGYGINGTPTFFINENKVMSAQPIEVFKQIILRSWIKFLLLTVNVGQPLLVRG